MDPKKFKLGDAVQILLDRDCPVLSKTWTLARLMAWMCLDQRRGTRKRNPKTGRPIRANRQRRDAKLAGHLALASILDRRFKPGQFDGSDEVVRLFVEFRSLPTVSGEPAWRENMVTPDEESY